MAARPQLLPRRSAGRDFPGCHAIMDCSINPEESQPAERLDNSRIAESRLRQVRRQEVALYSARQ